MPPNVPAISLPTAGVYGYAPTSDPTQDSVTHALSSTGPSNGTYITAVDETATLPNSQKLANIIIRGAFGSLPAAGTAGRLYITSDTFAVYYDTGTIWQKIAPGLNNGGTVPPGELGTGTANNTVFLRGDGVWATATSSGVSAGFVVAMAASL